MALSRQGRRITGPVPRWAGGLGAFILFVYFAAFTLYDGSSAQPAQVRYIVAVQGLADVEMTSPGGRLKRTRTDGLFEDFVFHDGDKVSVTARGVGGILVTCRLEVDGSAVAQFTGPYAACGGKVGDPASYMPPPMSGPGNDYAQAGDRMELPRYSGRSSLVAGRSTDRAAGISYARLGGGWDTPPREGQSSVPGSVLTLRQESRPERGWFAFYGSGRMNPDLLYRYTGENRLFQAALAEMDTYTTWTDVTYQDIVSAPLTVDGREAWVITRQETFSPKASTNIRTILLTMVMIDTGLGRPVYFFVSMPDPAQDYLPDVNRLISSIRVL
ncbi:hypothetical protein Pth03_10710 [Planotetraspora thailandica]|uniref:Uncharacterized protein n=1 Tax=Planotetraspora thailandica TaxID=487172 RepID=A0A8J3UWG6_9ACTN|nr:hypothetical protein [Planotetraspora thailandica]GII52682.1 hypothetical protein Pth03_10710 [Planotetraspora thailandica]